jgi:hypothetical protein
MTALGKILVIVNLVFALVTGALIVMVNVKWTNWYSHATKLQKQLDLERETTATAQREVEETKKKADEHVQKAGAELNDARTRLAGEQKAHQATRELLVAEQTKYRGSAANTTDAAAELDRRKQEVEQLQQEKADREKKILEIQDQAKAFRDRAVNAELAIRTLQERNSNLLAEREALAKDLERTRAAGSGLVPGRTASAVNPPPEDVRGRVTAAEPDGLLTINLGTDAGITKDHTLYVYRLDPRPDYLGVIRIVDANHREAVARPVSPERRGRIRVGDQVATSIMGTAAINRR